MLGIRGLRLLAFAAICSAVWFAGMVLIGLGAAVDRPVTMVAQPDLYIGRRWQFVAPSGLIVLMGGFVRLGPLLDAGGGAMIRSR